MNNRKLGILILSILCTTSAQKSNEEERHKQFPNDGTGLPLPKFDLDYDQVLSSIQKRFNAESVELSRPYQFNSVKKREYWLKVFLLNPEIPQVGDDPFTAFTENVAKTTYSHLTNSDDFNNIEIRVTQKAGTVVRFSSSMSKFLVRDSLLRSSSLPSR